MAWKRAASILKECKVLDDIEWERRYRRAKRVRAIANVLLEEGWRAQVLARRKALAKKPRSSMKTQMARTPRARRSRRKSVRRTIYFYRMRFPNDAPTFDLYAVEDAVSNLSAAPPGRQRYQVEDDGSELWVEPDGHGRLRFGRTRHRDLPQVELSLQLSPLQIPPASGLSEVIHVVFFPNHIVGTDYNFDGPRLSRLGGYLSEKCPNLCPQVDFDPLLRPRIARRLNQFRDLTLLRIRALPSYASTLAHANKHVGAMFEAASSDGLKYLDITLKANRGNTLPARLLAFVRNLIGRDDLRDGVTALEIEGHSSLREGVDEINLLRWQLVASEDVILEDRVSRALNTDSAYAAVSAAYTRLHSEIIQAPGISRT